VQFPASAAELSADVDALTVFNDGSRWIWNGVVKVAG
jgi:hypothetical protein